MDVLPPPEPGLVFVPMDTVVVNDVPITTVSHAHERHSQPSPIHAPTRIRAARVPAVGAICGMPVSTDQRCAASEER